MKRQNNIFLRSVLLICTSLFTAFILDQNVYADVNFGPTIVVFGVGIIIVFGIGIALCIGLSLWIIKKVKKNNEHK